MNPLVWLIGALVGGGIGLAASLVRRPQGLVANALIGVLGGGIGAWLATVFGVAIEAKVTLAASAAGGAVVLVGLLWALRRN